MTGARIVHDTLEACGWWVEIADAQKVKGLAPLACKTDKIDSKVLAVLSHRDLVPAIWLPDPSVREERELARFRLHLVKHKSALKNRIHSTLINFGKPCPVTDLFGVEGRADPSVREERELARFRLHLVKHKSALNLGVDLVGLARQRREPLDLLGVGDLDIPALLLEGVVDDPRAGHRLDHRAHRLAVHLLDAASEPSKRVDVGRYGKLIQVLSLIGEQANVKLLST